MNGSGFIFDLDGVIVDTAKYHYLAWKKLADQLGFEFTEEQNERFKGVSRRRCLEILLELGQITVSQQQFDTWLIEKNEDYLTYIEKMDESENPSRCSQDITFLKGEKYSHGPGIGEQKCKTYFGKGKVIALF